jgi:hypothetical protein
MELPTPSCCDSAALLSELVRLMDENLGLH